MIYTDILQVIATNLIWQTALIAGAVFTALKILPRTQVQTRYQIALTGMIGTLLLFAVPFSPKLPTGITVLIEETLPLTTPKITPAITENVTNSERLTPTIPEASASLPLGIILMNIWLFGIFIMLIRLVAAAHAGTKWRELAKPIPQTSNTKLSKPVDVLRSKHINAPMVLGLLHPIILVPDSFEFNLELPEARTVLEHEIAHITRHDLWVNFAQRLILALLWWCLPLYWLNTQIGAEREKLCDDIATQKVGVIEKNSATNEPKNNGHILARALLDLAEAQIHHRPPLLAIGIHPKASLLAERIKRLYSTASIPKTSKKLLLSTSLAVPLTLAAITMLTPSALARHPHAQDNLKPDERHTENVQLSTQITSLQRALYQSAERGYLDSVKNLLVQGVNPNFVLHGDGTPLLVAIRRNDETMLDIFIAAGADVNLAANGDGNPLIHAAMRGYLDMAKTLVEHGADVNARVLHDETPLINAARHGHIGIVKYLLSQDADVNLGMWSDHSDQREWRTPLGEARKSGHDDVVKYLNRNGAHTETRTYNPVSNSQHSEVVSYAETNSTPTKRTSILIVEGRVTSTFGKTRKGKKHRGIDIANKVGTPIYAPADGQITLAAEKFSFRENYGKTDHYGKTIELKTAGDVTTLFAHLNGFNVTLGDDVRAGDLIGYMGNTGVSTGPHVHIETKINGNLINPDHVWPNLEP